MHDPEGHLRNAASQKIDGQVAVIHEPEAVVLEAANTCLGCCSQCSDCSLYECSGYSDP
ncbi:hypothetical protein F2Q68_00030307 [Brassica cretica]|uniref:Uncharacterized protein n=1 Tax=Brassica cretica TaxID=69181 RepID=A0A8S9GJ10_BRACR|nr:hypothetical protein F2Q68_00030307 [Brassica cretica]